MIPTLQMSKLRPRESGGLAHVTGWVGEAQPGLSDSQSSALSLQLLPPSKMCDHPCSYTCSLHTSSRKPPRRRPHIQNPPELRPTCYTQMRKLVLCLEPEALLGFRCMDPLD